MSLRELADKYAISRGHLGRVAAREDWHRKKLRFRENRENTLLLEAIQMLAEKATEILAEYNEELIREIVRINRRVFERVDETLDYDEPFCPRDLKLLNEIVGEMLSNRRMLYETGKGEESRDSGELVIRYVDEAGNACGPTGRPIPPP